MFKTTDNFRAIIFSTFVNENESEIVIHGREDEVNTLLSNMRENLDVNFEQIKKQEEVYYHLDDIFYN